MNRPNIRFSLLSALLMVTIVGLSIVLVQLWREVEPLRAEVRRMRTELGMLNVDDPAVAQAIQIGTGDSDRWKWRVYLPPGRKYELRCCSGRIPPATQGTNRAWLDAVKNSTSGSSGTCRDGEFVLAFGVIKEDDVWYVTSSEGNGKNFGKTSVDGDWLSQPMRSTTSMTSMENATKFAPGEPILLFSTIAYTRTPTGWIPPQGTTDGIVVWIEQQSPVAAGSPTSP